MRNLLISAYACEPLKGSEQGVGWNWVIQMAKYNNLHVITRANNKTLIQEYLPSALEERINFYYYDTNDFLKSLKNKDKGLYFYYFCWQLGIIPIVKRLSKQISFDYSMHLTMGSIWMPTFLPFFNIPFIWGPLGGGEGVPLSFIKNLPIRSKIFQSFRYILKLKKYFDPLFFFSSYRAVCIITRTKNTSEFFLSIFSNKIHVFLETAIEKDIFSLEKIHDNKKRKIKLIMTGRLVPFKNTETVVKALPLIQSKFKYELNIIGSGPEEKKIKNLISKLNLKKKVKLFNQMKRKKVLEELSKSDIYLFPSLREGGSWALMEAMAIGLPVI